MLMVQLESIVLLFGRESRQRRLSSGCIVSETGTALWKTLGEAVVCGRAAFDFYCAELE